MAERGGIRSDTFISIVSSSSRDAIGTKVCPSILLRCHNLKFSSNSSRFNLAFKPIEMDGKYANYMCTATHSKCFSFIFFTYFLGQFLKISICPQCLICKCIWIERNILLAFHLPSTELPSTRLYSSSTTYPDSSFMCCH